MLWAGDRFIILISHIIPDIQCNNSKEYGYPFYVFFCFAVNYFEVLYFLSVARPPGFHISFLVSPDLEVLEWIVSQ